MITPSPIMQNRAAIRVPIQPRLFVGVPVGFPAQSRSSPERSSGTTFAFSSASIAKSHLRPSRRPRIATIASIPRIRFKGLLSARFSSDTPRIYGLCAFLRQTSTVVKRNSARRGRRSSRPPQASGKEQLAKANACVLQDKWPLPLARLRQLKTASRKTAHAPRQD